MWRPRVFMGKFGMRNMIIFLQIFSKIYSTFQVNSILIEFTGKIKFHPHSPWTLHIIGKKQFNAEVISMNCQICGEKVRGKNPTLKMFCLHDDNWLWSHPIRVQTSFAVTGMHSTISSPDCRENGLYLQKLRMEGDGVELIKNHLTLN